jgi:D-sedoheptulose 7-phosphate isomerase
MTGDSAVRNRWTNDLDAARRVIDAIHGALDQVELVGEALYGVVASGGCVYACGNGGSALAAQHFVAELVAHFQHDRRALPGVALTADGGMLTAIANDYGFADVFSRQVQGLVRPGDALVVFSTSGRSENVLAAVRTAREAGVLSIAFTGRDGSELAHLSDHVLLIDDPATARIQEGHLVLIHLICEGIDTAFADS